MSKIKLACIVDDDDIFRFIMSKHLTTQNLAEKIITFVNGEEILDFIVNNNKTEELPDVIFLDINMPVMDGWQFIEELQKIYEKLAKVVTIYMVSSSVDDRDVSRAKSTKIISEYVVKPMAKNTLVDLVNRFNLKTNS